MSILDFLNLFRVHHVRGCSANFQPNFESPFWISEWNFLTLKLIWSIATEMSSSSVCAQAGQSCMFFSWLLFMFALSKTSCSAYVLEILGLDWFPCTSHKLCSSSVLFCLFFSHRVIDVFYQFSGRLVIFNMEELFLLGTLETLWTQTADIT